MVEKRLGKDGPKETPWEKHMRKLAERKRAKRAVKRGEADSEGTFGRFIASCACVCSGGLSRILSCSPDYSLLYVLNSKCRIRGGGATTLWRRVARGAGREETGRGTASARRS